LARDATGRDSTTCCPKSHTFQVAGDSPGWQVAGSAFPTANRQPLPPYMGRVEHPCSTAADQGWSALPRLEISHGRHDGDTSREGLCPESARRYISRVAQHVITKYLQTRATWSYFILSSLRVCWTQCHAPAEPRGLRPAGFLFWGVK